MLLRWLAILMFCLACQGCLWSQAERLPPPPNGDWPEPDPNHPERGGII